MKKSSTTGPTDAVRFHSLFTGWDKAHGVFFPGAARLKIRGKLKGGQATEEGGPTAELWQDHLDGKKGLGVFMLRLDATVRFAAIDVDSYPVDLKKLAKKITKLKLPLVVCRSKSGGAHLYLFGKEDLPAPLVRQRLLEWANMLDVYSLVERTDKIEFFPHKDELAGPADFGKYLNMPYFGGAETDRYALGADGKILDIQSFIIFATARSVTSVGLTEIEGGELDALKEGPPCLQALLATGPITEYRDNTLLNLGVYLRQRFPDNWEDKIEDYHRRFVEVALPASDVVKVIRSVAKRTYNYMCGQEPIVSRCNSIVCTGRKYGVRAKAKENGQNVGFDLNLGQLVKFTTDPVSYELEVNGKTLQLTLDQLLSYTDFRKVAVAQCDILPARLKGETWDEMVREKIAAQRVEEAPPDAGESGQVQWHLQRFCSNMRARAKEELKDGRPWWDEEEKYVYFRIPHLLEHLQRHRIFMSAQHLSTFFRKWKYTHGQFNIRGVCVQWWRMPAFAVQDEADDVPRPGKRASKF